MTLKISETAWALLAYILILALGSFISLLYKDSIAPIVPVIGVLGLLIGLTGFFFQLRRSGRQLAHLQKVTQKMENFEPKMEQIARSMQTRFIGSFPKHLVDVLELVNRAQKNDEVRIMADCVDYGSFSDPELHRTLFRAIQDAAQMRKVKVTILLSGNPATTPFSLSSPFKGRNYDTDLKNDHDFQTCLADYCEFHGDESEPNNYEEFRKMLSHRHATFQEGLLDAGVSIYERRNTETPEPNATEEKAQIPDVFLWIEDDEDAVFLLTHTGAGAQGLAFRTRDSTLIKIFNSMFEDKLKEAQQVKKTLKRPVIQAAPPSIQKT